MKNPYTIDGCLEKPPLITDCLGSRWFQDMFPIPCGQLKHDRLGGFILVGTSLEPKSWRSPKSSPNHPRHGWPWPSFETAIPHFMNPSFVSRVLYSKGFCLKTMCAGWWFGTSRVAFDPDATLKFKCDKVWWFGTFSQLTNSYFSEG